MLLTEHINGRSIFLTWQAPDLAYTMYVCIVCISRGRQSVQVLGQGDRALHK